MRSRGGRRAPADPAGFAHMKQRWGSELAAERYLNPNLVVRDGRLKLKPV
jgi:hypothetical protein